MASKADKSEQSAPGGQAEPAARLRRFLPIALIGLAIAAVLTLGLDDHLSFEALRGNRDLLLHFVEEHAVQASLAFFALYAVSTALSLPGGAALSIAGGFLFGTLLGTLWIVLAATLGAVAIFLAARSALGDNLKARAGPWLGKLEAGFQENALSYLLVLRLIPIFPFFIVNLVPAFLGVSLRVFTVATLIGIVPGAFVFASVGAGLGSVFEMDGELSAQAVLTPEVITALVGLAALSLLPVAYKKLRKARNPDGSLAVSSTSERA